MGSFLEGGALRVEEMAIARARAKAMVSLAIYCANFQVFDDLFGELKEKV